MLNGTWGHSNVSLLSFNLQKRLWAGQTPIKLRLPFNLSIHRINNEKRWFYDKTRHLVKIYCFAFYFLVWLIIKTFIICQISLRCILRATLRCVIRHNLGLNQLHDIWRYKSSNLPMIVQTHIRIYQRVSLVIFCFQVTNRWVIEIRSRRRMANYNAIYHYVKIATYFIKPIWIWREVNGLAFMVLAFIFIYESKVPR